MHWSSSINRVNYGSIAISCKGLAAANSMTVHAHVKSHKTARWAGRPTRPARCSYSLVDSASRSVERERRGYRVGDTVPGAVKSHTGEAAAGGDASVVALVGYRHIRAALDFISIPERRDCLAIGKAPGQCPIAQRGASVVDDGDVRAEGS